MGARQSGMGGPRGPPPDIMVEVLASLVVSAVGLLAATVAVKALDPNKGTKKKAEAVKRAIAQRLGRPNIVTTPYEDMIAGDVANPNTISTTFDEIGGLGDTKRALQEIVILPLLRPELFSGGSLLKPVKGCLLYGPPGTGKTLLAKALAKECHACFINVRTSTLQSKWFGDANKLVSAVFSLAWKLQPSIIFIDEVDSFLGRRGKGNEHEANTSMKTEFMTMWDGFQTNENAMVMVLAATNRPWDVDEAILRANRSRYGLCASVWGDDPEQTRRVADQLDVGGVFVNQVPYSDPRLPFGGVRDSGHGRELGTAGIRELVALRTLSLG